MSKSVDGVGKVMFSVNMSVPTHPLVNSKFYGVIETGTKLKSIRPPGGWGQYRT